MKASIAKAVKEALSDRESARVLTAAIIEQSRTSDVIKVELPNGKKMELKRVKLPD